MKKAIIICWFGPFPNYFKIWEKSCGYNNDYDFYLFTNQDYKSKYNNVFVIKKSLDEMNTLFSQKLNMKIKIKKPYKFCDFRPAYGVIFEDYLLGYDFWGHCDVDEIFGKIKNFISDEDLKKFERINKNGHFSLYKNNEKINNLYKDDKAKFNYKEVFNGVNNNYAFDEYTGINMICEKNNISYKYINKFADIDVRYSRYRTVNEANYNFQCFTWENGKIYRVFLENEKIEREELMYLHFQKKNPKLQIDEKFDNLIIGSRYISKIKNNMSQEEILDSNPFLGEKYERKEHLIYIMMKLKIFFKCDLKQKIIWIRQKV